MGLVGLLFTAKLSVVFTGPLPLLRLRGEDILLRVRTSAVTALLVDEAARDLKRERARVQKLLQKEHKFPLARQKLCKAPAAASRSTANRTPRPA